MGWDTEGRRKLLLDAATLHFAAHGMAGARIAAIADDAGVNRERIYQYFGDKQALRTEVQKRAMTESLAQAEITGTGPAALAGFAGQLFDIYAARPELARLLAWETLENTDPFAGAVRIPLWDSRVESLRAALPHLDELRARHLLLTVFTLVTSWWSLYHMQAVILPGNNDDPARRAMLLEQVKALAAAPRTS
ncbi:TetR family transcriptional regulator [Nocardia sp. NPDC059240]|uniref:TetR family transcriptional regulator n=1 Tax=Nocardia sp. NPDC059240 TaxID=3346786 RepID=UPI0036C34538